MIYPNRFPCSLALFALLFGPLLVQADSSETFPEAESQLWLDPAKSLALLADRLEGMDADDRVSWRGEDVSVEKLRQRMDFKQAAFAATERRFTFSKFCTDQLIGPDRVNASLQLARREARDGRMESAFARAEAEELIGTVRVHLLAEMARHFQTEGENATMRQVANSMYEYSANFDLRERQLVLGVIADWLAEAENWPHLVGLAHEMSGWKSPYFLSRAVGLFPEESIATVRNQAIGLAQQEDPGEKALALIKIAGGFAADGQVERAERLVASAKAAADEISGREKALAYGALAGLALRLEKEDAAAAYFDTALTTVMEEMEGWRQTDAFIELAVKWAGTPVADIAGGPMEEAAFVLAEGADDDGMRNKYRVYEVFAIAAASSPADAYSESERLALFRELVRLQAMPDNDVTE